MIGTLRALAVVAIGIIFGRSLSSWGQSQRMLNRFPHGIMNPLGAAPIGHKCKGSELWEESV